jgi:predicted transcriptional regulator
MIPDEDILSALEDCDPPFQSTSEVAEAVGVTRQGADQRLRELAEEGQVRKAKKGGSLIWWHPDRVD